MPATILHLTDLHLGDGTDGGYVGDYSKSGIVSPEDRTTRTQLLRETLRELGRWLKREKRSLTAIVVSGDITVAGHESGYQQFAPLLDELGGSRPDPGHVVVVPGNHDVTWGTEPSSDRRYELFRRYVCDRDYVVPPLSSNDTFADRNLLVNEKCGFVMVPFNSSNWCGVLEPLGELDNDEISAAFVPDARGDQVRHLVDRLRMQDAARIPPQHLSNAREGLERVDPERRLRRIAVLHHQLLPVSTVEEVKPFENLVNLQLFRQFLRDNGFSLVLHGHKHVGERYYDHLVPADAPFAPDAPLTLVIAGSTVGGVLATREDCCRIVELRGPAHASVARVTPIDVVDAGGRWIERQAELFPLWPAPRDFEARQSGPTVVRGRSVDEVYDRLLQVAGAFSEDEPAVGIVCHIEEGEGVTLPSGYPTKFLGERDPQEWLQETVEWWQQPGRSRDHGSLIFSHGDRIRRYDDHQDQLDAVARLLAQRGTYNGRTIISLLDAAIDVVAHPQHKFPAFVTAQFVKRLGRAGRYFLDCTAYYRKQELRYWWPVNIAELRHMQAHLVKELGDTFAPGTVTTFSTVAYAGMSPPRVAVPRIDQFHEDDPDRIMRLALTLVRHPSLERA